MSDYFYLLLLTIKKELNNKYFQGTSLKHLQKNLFLNKDIYIPSSCELEKFNSIVQPMLETISKNTRETKNLIFFRNFLLPLLINNKATIDD